MSLKYQEPKWLESHKKEGMRSATRNKKHKNILHLAFQKLRLPWIRKAFWLTVENVSFPAEEKLNNASALNNNLYYE